MLFLYREVYSVYVFLGFICEREASTSVHIPIYVILALRGDGLYKWPERFVQDKWMHSIWSVVFVLIKKQMSFNKHSGMMIPKNKQLLVAYFVSDYELPCKYFD